MKLLHVTDLHFRRHWFDWISSQADRYDSVCISGDLLDIFAEKETSFKDQIKWVCAWIRAHKGKIFICSGNHDWWNSYHGISDTNARGGWLRKTSSITVAVDGSRRVDGEYQFVCLPWFGVPRDFEPLKRVVLVTHCPPTGAGVGLQGGKDCGDGALTAALKDVSALVLCGHIHSPARWFCPVGRSLCINPGCDFEQAEPNHAIIDVNQKQIVHMVGGQAVGAVQVQEYIPAWFGQI